MTIGERVRKRRLQLGLTVDQVADMLGKHRAMVYRYEKDLIKNIPKEVLVPLAEILRTTPMDLQGYGKDPEVEAVEEGKMRYRYYSVMRPIGIGTFPKREDVDFRFTNFDHRRWCEEIGGSAWGFIETDVPYTETECQDYELVPEKKLFPVKILLEPEQIMQLEKVASENTEIGMNLNQALQYLVNINHQNVVEAVFQ